MSDFKAFIALRQERFNAMVEAARKFGEPETVAGLEGFLVSCPAVEVRRKDGSVWTLVRTEGPDARWNPDDAFETFVMKTLRSLPSEERQYFIVNVSRPEQSERSVKTIWDPIIMEEPVMMPVVNIGPVTDGKADTAPLYEPKPTAADVFSVLAADARESILSLLERLETEEFTPSAVAELPDKAFIRVVRESGLGKHGLRRLRIEAEHAERLFSAFGPDCEDEFLHGDDGLRATLCLLTTLLERIDAHRDVLFGKGKKKARRK